MRWIACAVLAVFGGVAPAAEPPPIKSPPPIKGFKAPAPAEAPEPKEKAGEPEVVVPTDPSQPAPPGYHWIKRGNGPWKCEKAPESKAPEVASPKGGTFQQGQYHAGHDCPACGRSQYHIAGYNRDGTHTHVCAAGHSWRH